MATIYHPADAPREITPANGTNFTLEEMQGIVGGYIQIINIGNGNVMVINEEGKLLNLPKNAHATIIAHQHKASFLLTTSLALPLYVVRMRHNINTKFQRL